MNRRVTIRGQDPAAYPMAYLIPKRVGRRSKIEPPDLSVANHGCLHRSSGIRLNDIKPRDGKLGAYT